jgi:hypothetical protein
MSSKISSAAGPMRLHATSRWSKRALSPALLETVGKTVTTLQADLAVVRVRPCRVLGAH